MNTLIQQDQAQRPELFAWNGPIAKDTMDEWLRYHNLELPTDLIDLWQETGGGDLFETETILAPFGTPAGNDVESVNEAYHRRGLNQGYLIVHLGGTLTAIRHRDKKWVVLDQNTFAELEEYDSLNSWYHGGIRAEYGDRYGLSTS